MHEVTGSSPVVPTIKKKGLYALSFLCVGKSVNLRPRISDAKNKHARARGARKPRRGDPFRGVGGALLSPSRRDPLRRCFFRGGENEPLGTVNSNGSKVYLTSNFAKSIDFRFAL